MKRYCFIIEIKEEYIKEYIDLHKNAWPEMVKAIKRAGVAEEIIYNYKNLSIVFFECDDIDSVYRRLADEQIVQKWDALVNPWFESEFVFLEKIFDLNQQLNGELELY